MVCRLSTFCRPVALSRNAVGARGRLQARERAIRIDLAQVAHPLFFDQIALGSVNHFMMRVMIRSSSSCNCALLGAPTSWNSGSPALR